MRHTTLLPLILVAAASIASAQSTTRASVTSSGKQTGAFASNAQITEDGRLVFFAAEPGLVLGGPPFTENIVVHDRQTGSTTFAVLPGGTDPNDYTYMGAISRDGRFLVFSSYATNLLPAASGLSAQAFLLDRNTSSLSLISADNAGIEGDSDSLSAVVSDDGLFVAFWSYASNLVPGDTNADADIFLRDRLAGTTQCVSVALNGLPSLSSYSNLPSISGDGRYVAFSSAATDLVSLDVNGPLGDVFLFDRLSGTNTLISRSSAGVQGDDECFGVEISLDGRFVAFDSYSTNLVPGDTNGEFDVFVRDLLNQTTQRVSLSSSGAQADSGSYTPDLSADGAQVAFTSFATNLVPGDTNGQNDLFLRDLLAGTTERISVTSAGAEAPPATLFPEIWSTHVCASGRYVAFSTYFEGLVPGDSNDQIDVLVRDRLSTVPPVTSYCTPKVNSLGCTPSIGTAGEPRLSGFDAFFISATNVRNNKPGLMIWGPNAGSSPFGGGILCISTPITRTSNQTAGGSPTGSDCTGSYSFYFSQTYMVSKGLSAGTTLRSQYWSRDQGFPAPNNIGLTSGVAFTIAP